jgi:hypothetical protein
LKHSNCMSCICISKKLQKETVNTYHTHEYYKKKTCSKSLITFNC